MGLIFPGHLGFLDWAFCYLQGKPLAALLENVPGILGCSLATNPNSSTCATYNARFTAATLMFDTGLVEALVSDVCICLRDSHLKNDFNSASLQKSQTSMVLRVLQAYWGAEAMKAVSWRKWSRAWRSQAIELRTKSWMLGIARGMFFHGLPKP